jgi:hypothetical protein
MIKIIEMNKKNNEILERIINDLKEAKCFVAISIKDDGMPQEHYCNVTPEQRIYLCEVAKQSAVDDFRGERI